MSAKARRIHVLTGGPFHPVTEQFRQIQKELGGRDRIFFYEGVQAFDHLRDCDLLVLGGLHWTGSAPDRHAWPKGVTPCGYLPPTPAQKKAYVDYVASGRALLGFHGGVASYDDWPEFGRLCGFTWDWRVTTHTAINHHAVTIEKTGHPAVKGVKNHHIHDELYFNIQATSGLPYQVHAWAHYANIRFPMIMTAEGGRIAGAGKTAYLANGHDLRAMECADFRRVIVNTLKWLLS